MNKTIILAALIIAIGSVHPAIDLVTVPKKEKVQLTIYNSADITMVRESRYLTFKKGANKIQFSWANTLIDPTSLRLRFLSKKDRLDLIDTTFLPNRNDALQWNIQSEISGPAKVEISYFTSGITWRADYVLTTNEDENRAELKGFVEVVNNSGEDYPSANIRLVVGHINLVEKISDLAKGQAVKYDRLSQPQKKQARVAFKTAVSKAKRNGAGGLGRRKAVVKEGLSEYFLFSIEGKETVRNNWRKRLLATYGKNIDLKTIYRLNDKRDTHVYKFYEFKNKKYAGRQGIGKMGDSPLPNGNFKIFTKAKNGNLSFRASVQSKYIATGDKVKLNSGRSLDVRIERKLKDYRRVKINVKRNYYKEPYVKNYVEIYSYETKLINTLPRKSDLEIIRYFAGAHKIKELPYRSYRVDKNRMKFFPALGARSENAFSYQVEVFRGSK